MEATTLILTFIGGFSTAFIILVAIGIIFAKKVKHGDK